MAGKKKSVKAELFGPESPDALFNKLRAGGAVEMEGQGDRDKIALVEPGQFFVFQLVRIGKSAKPNAKGEHFTYYHFNGLEKNERYFLVGSFDLDNRISDSHVGNVLAVWLVELVEMGKQSPMKVFAVLDCGRSWPELDDYHSGDIAVDG